MTISKLCPSCYSHKIRVFYSIQNVPVNSVLLLASKEEALNFPRGDILLGFCETCGFIYNLAFNYDLLEYSTRYEATQGFSSTFNAFHHALAEHLIDQYDLHSKDIIEIGCGQGEFLKLLCESGNNRGVGFDPVFHESRSELDLGKSITIIKDFYSEKYANIHADFVCCKMTLEHIQNTAVFVNSIGRILRGKSNTIVFFQVPDVTRILRDVAFWDIYYEHCSYFSPGSLARLFRRSGFDLIDLKRDYDDQYLVITVKPDTGKNTSQEAEDDLSLLTRDVEQFAERCKVSISEWQQKLKAFYRAGKRIVLWGASSKAVAFLTTLKIEHEISYAVDINPNKAGTYLAGSGHKIVSPEFLIESGPDIVLVMNPVYTEEIKGILSKVGVNAQLLSL